MLQVRILSLSIIFSIFIPFTTSINCYECSSSQGSDCVSTATSCQYGVFGCTKFALLSGGVDKMGMFYDREKSIVTMYRGCLLFPFFGNVDMCRQTSILGTRLLVCTCFNDYCNSAPQHVSILLLLIFILLFYSCF